MKDLKEQLEEMFSFIELDEETELFLKSIQEKIEEVKINNNNIISSKENFEDTIYNLDKLIPEKLRGAKNDNKKDT